MAPGDPGTEHMLDFFPWVLPLHWIPSPVFLISSEVEVGILGCVLQVFTPVTRLSPYDSDLLRETQASFLTSL